MDSKKITVLCGIDREAELSSLVQNKKVALLTAASGVNKRGIPSYRIINRYAQLKLLFTPEHGLYSALQDGKFGDDEGTLHQPTGAFVYGLTSKGCSQFVDLLKSVDIVIYDIQDVGARFYTYLCNLTQLMRACKDARKPFIVLDRPNPIGGIIREGIILDESRFSSFVGEFSIPTRYGLTVGEYALWANKEKGIECDLTVLPCEGWKRNLYYDETDLLWVNPSPNIPSVNAALNYIGGCIYEATNVSEGRGTTRPFDWIGAPFIDEDDLCDHMSGLSLPGVIFRPLCFTPMYNKWNGELCHGVELHITDRNIYMPYRTMLHMFSYLKQYPQFEMKRSGMNLRVGQDVLYESYDPEDLYGKTIQGVSEYSKIAEKYKLYSY